MWSVTVLESARLDRAGALPEGGVAILMGASGGRSNSDRVNIQMIYCRRIRFRMTTEQSARTPYIRGEERLAKVVRPRSGTGNSGGFGRQVWASDRLSRNRQSYRFKKLNAQIHIEIRRRARAGEQVKALAVEYGIAQHRVVHRQRAESNITSHVKVRATQAKVRHARPQGFA